MFERAFFTLAVGVLYGTIAALWFAALLAFAKFVAWLWLAV